MEKHVSYKTQGVCSRGIEFDIVDGIVRNVQFIGGCRGNTQGVAKLAEGMEATRKVIEAIRPGQSVGIFIGPEGGFEKEEVMLALSEGAKEITLGKRILRTETAGLTTLSILMYHLENETA